MWALMWALEWMLACAGSMAVGLLTWALLDGAARVWPALRTHRVVWLAAQSVVAAAAVLPFLPHAGSAPQITLAIPDAMRPAARATAPATTRIAAEALDVPQRGAAAIMATVAATDTDAVRPTTEGVLLQEVAEHTQMSRAVSWLAALWLLVYAAGLARAVARRLRARRLWRTLLASAHRLSPQALHAHGAFNAAQLREIADRKLSVLRTDAAISPMLTGVFQPRLLLPAHLDALSLEQQHMIIAHELHHLQVRDPLYLAIASILQTIFWFNPTLRWMAKQMEWALELRCDQYVLADRPQQQRKQYAAALLRQWTTITPAGAAAFGGATIATRIRSMQQDGLPRLNAAVAWLTAAALVAILALAMALQPALAYSQPSAVEPLSPVEANAAMHSATAGAMQAAEAWRAPLDKVRVTSFFGVMRSVLPTPHKGIDFAAAKGTPVHATASGVVIAAGPLAENQGRYGTAVVIDHGAQQSLYAHLDRVSVRPGQRVAAGEVIGASGQSGFATGPHLHLEVRENGKIVDPAPRFDNLDAYATPRALKVRRQQQG